MTLETDEAALARFANNDAGAATEEFKGVLAGQKIYHVFLVYMRVNEDGTFKAERLFYKAKDASRPIAGDTSDPTKVDTLGWYTKDMVSYGRLPVAQRDGRYESQGSGLSGFIFPSYISYIVFFMDDAHWPYLKDKGGNPVIHFRDQKEGDPTPYLIPKYAFTPAISYQIPMTNIHSGLTTPREALMMVNTMHDYADKPLGDGVREKFCFDLVMRVRYAGSTDGLTIIIDPTGDNLGPPLPPY